MMKIVIDIPESIYKASKMMKNYDVDVVQLPLWVIAKGTPLPKGHGRLIDTDKLEPRDMSPEPWYSPMWGFELIDIEDAPTIIEADKTESEG